MVPNGGISSRRELPPAPVLDGRPARGRSGGGGSGRGRPNWLCLIFGAQVLLFVAVTLAAFTFFTSHSLATAELEKELVTLRAERAALQAQLDGRVVASTAAAQPAPAAAAAAAARPASSTLAAAALPPPLSESALRLALNGECAEVREGWWVYELCFFHSVRQFHPADAHGRFDEYSLGRFHSAEPPTRQLYAGGDKCGSRTRETRVALECGAAGEGPRILKIEEVRTCEYIARVATHAACAPGEKPAPLPEPAPSAAADAKPAAAAAAAAAVSTLPDRGRGVAPGVAITPAPPVRGGTSTGPTPPPSRYAHLPSSGAAALGEKAAAVVEAFTHSWGAYRAHAWGKDEYQPLKQAAKPDWIGLGLTTVDALSTLRLMNLTSQWAEARAWVETSLDAERALSKPVSFFETVIRCLGGLLSAHELSGDPLFLRKAEDVGLRLAKAFGSPSGLPYAQINLHTGAGSVPSWTSGNVLLAEVGTVQLEFFKLAQLTGRRELRDAAAKAFALLDEAHPKVAPLLTPSGGRLYPIHISPTSGRFVGQTVSFGAMGDSFYEYTLKLYLLVGRSEPRYLRMYREVVTAVRDTLLHTSDDGLSYVAEMANGRVVHKMDHLACFFPGLLALGARQLRALDAAAADEDLALAKSLAATCYQMYARQQTGVAPEYVRFAPGRGMYNGANHNLLRPETAESLFILWRVTKDPTYREWGWAIFLAFDRWCRVESGGFAGLKDVTSANPAKDDTMQSFWLAETLKYLFLLFADDDALDLDEWVLNTEAHPLRAMPAHALAPPANGTRASGGAEGGGLGPAIGSGSGGSSARR